MNRSYKILGINVRPTPETEFSPFPALSKPVPIGHFSVSDSGHFEIGNRELRFLVLPTKFPFSVKTPNVKIKSDMNASPDLMDHMLHFIESHKHNFVFFNGTYAVLKSDIVCSRDVLRLMMCTPYELTSNWCLAVTKYRETIYICRMDNSDGVNKPMDSHRTKCPYRPLNPDWLEKLYDYCLLQDVDGTPRRSEHRGQYHCVFKTEIEGINIIYDASVIGEYFTSCDGDLPTFTTLKLRYSNMNRAEWLAHNRTQSIKWWTESFLVGIENVIIGMCDDDGNVLKFFTSSSRAIWKDSEKDWSTCVCAHFMVRMLQAIKGIMENVDCPNTVCKFEFEVDENRITYSYFEGRNPYTFIPDWYRIMMNEFS